jgi:hypothetical protein
VELNCGSAVFDLSIGSGPAVKDWSAVGKGCVGACARGAVRPSWISTCPARCVVGAGMQVRENLEYVLGPEDDQLGEIYIHWPLSTSYPAHGRCKY